MIIPLTKLPDKILREKTKPAIFPLSGEVKKLVKDMIDTVRAADGIGLAAPQVGRSLKLVIINLEKSGVPLFVLFNPKIVSKSFKKVEIEEGCLSVPGVFGLVKRPKKVKIQAQNTEGKKIAFSDDGWVARVVQHEIDHINGILIVDHIKKYTRGEELLKNFNGQAINDPV